MAAITPKSNKKNKEDPLKQVFLACLTALEAGEYYAKVFSGKCPHTGPLERKVAVEEVIHFILYGATYKIEDPRFKALLEYVLVPNISQANKQILRNATSLDIMNFVSPDSEGFAVKNIS